MTYKTHTTMAFAICFAPVLLPEQLNFIQYIDISLFPYIFLTIFLFSLFPDLDEPNSYLSRKPPWNIFSLIISSFTDHRGVTHRFLAIFIPPLIMFFILYSINKVDTFWPLILFSFIAYSAHLIGDGFTIGGLKRFFYPFSKKTIWFLPKSLRFKTNSFTEKIWLFFFTCIFIFEIYIYIQKTNILNSF